MEFLLEAGFRLVWWIVVEVVGQVVAEAAFEAIGWALRRRWIRLLVGLGAGLGGGVAWSLWVVSHQAPVVATAVVVAQLSATPIVTHPRVAGARLGRRDWLELSAIGVAVVAGRWLGWSIDESTPLR